MSAPYEFVDIQARGPEMVARAFGNQVEYCRAAGAPITARVVAALGALVAGDAGGAVLARVRDWPGAPLADALPLRLAGAIHALHLAGDEPALTPIYADEPADDAGVLGDLLLRREVDILPWLDGPPQTNEVGRSASLIAALLWPADQGLPPRFELLEIGSSAGINLMLSRYRYDLGGVVVGPEGAAIRLAPEWQGAPPPDCSIEIVSTAGCDIAPVDLTDPAQALRLKAYVWPEHRERFARIDAAIAEATRSPPDLVQMNAADFVAQQLARPQAEGTTRVLMHSIVWQYVPDDQQVRIEQAMAAAGAAATAGNALAWVALEANRVVHHHELVVRRWPGDGTPHRLARAHPHGAWIGWGEFDRLI